MTKTEKRLEELRPILGCEPEKIRPCLLGAWSGDPGGIVDNPYLQHEALKFVGLEVLSVCSAACKQTALDALRSWAVARGISRLQVDALGKWSKTHDFGHKGCNGSPYPKACCIGKKACPWYKSAPWQDDDRRGKDFNAFCARGWPVLVDPDAFRVYKALYDFEEARNLRAGGTLFFTRREARDLTGNMREPKQRAALERLEQAGLVKVLSWGEPRRKGQKGQPRTVARKVPIPYCK